MRIKFGIKDIKEEELLKKKEKLKYLRKNYRSLQQTIAHNSRNELLNTDIIQDTDSISSSEVSKKQLPVIKLND